MSQYLLSIFVFEAAVLPVKTNSSGPCLVFMSLEKKSIKVEATIEEGTGNDAQKRKGTEREGGSEYSWVSGSDRASMIGNVRSLQYEV